MIWIAVQVVMLPFSPLQPVIFVICAVGRSGRLRLAATIRPRPRPPAAAWIRRWPPIRPPPRASPASPPSSTAPRPSRSIETRLVRGRLRLPDHPVDHDGRALSGGGRRRADRPVGDARCGSSSRSPSTRRPPRPRARARRCSGHQLHRRPRPDPHEGGPVRHRGQAPPGRVPHRRSRPDEPGAQHPRRPRRRHGRRGHRLGDPVRPQRPGGRRPHGDRSPGRRGDGDALLRRAGRVPHDPHAGDVRAARGRAAARVRRRPARARSAVVRPAPSR